MSIQWRLIRLSTLVRLAGPTAVLLFTISSGACGSVKDTGKEAREQRTAGAQPTTKAMPATSGERPSGPVMAASMARPAGPDAAEPKDPPAGKPRAMGPLSARERKIFWGSSEDEPNKFLHGVNRKFEGMHHIWSDEWNLHLFHPHIKGLGGGYVGVGASQAYLLIGWIRPAFAWLIDYDAWIVAMHSAFRVLFLAAETPAAFVAHFRPKQKRRTLALLDKAHAGDPRRALILRVWRIARPKLLHRFDRVIRTLRRAGIPSYLTDAETYRYVRAQIEHRRIRPLSANLLEEKGLRGIGAAARQLKIPIRALYLSNAEEYWTYGPNFRKNIQGLPFDDRSYLLRTVAAKSPGYQYFYSLQPALNYLKWLATPGITNAYQMTKAPRKRPTSPYLSITTEGPGQLATEHTAWASWRLRRLLKKEKAQARKRRDPVRSRP